jgi:uncharacterized protein
MSRTIFLIVLLSIFAGIEVFTFYGLKSAIRPGWGLRVAKGVHLFGVLVTVVTVAGFFLTMRNGLSSMGATRNWLMGLMVTFMVTKLTFSAILLLGDVTRLMEYLFGKSSALVRGDDAAVAMPSRRRFIGQAGLLVAAIPFSAFLYGVIKGRYDYTVHRVKLAFADLPEAFHGMKLVQISDIHAGSWDDKEAVARGVAMIQAENPDLLVFTGDLVNNLSSEILPYKDLFASLHAPLGKFAVLGNHDYGDYVPWDSLAAKHANTEEVKQHNADMGFQMLNNGNVVIERGGQQIRLAGVENWGKPPFPQHGDLNTALAQVAPEEFTILLSHDPTHWDMQVRDHPKHVHLTLSGHTHGFQMGIEIPGIKWSPVQWRYKRWAGIYEEGGQHLYVNRGFGYIGFPGRVGIWPEITVIELARA